MTVKGMLREVHFHGEEGHVAHLAALCPACGFEHSFNVDIEVQGRHANDLWSFNGDYDKPTFSPSMLCNPGGRQAGHPVCHSFLREGVWQFLGDCSHEMVGQHVPMIPPEVGATFQRRHGWHLFPWTDDEGNPKEDNNGDQG